MDRVNSFRGCLLKDQGFFPVSLYFRSSSKPKILLEIRRRFTKSCTDLEQFSNCCKLYRATFKLHDRVEGKWKVCRAGICVSRRFIVCVLAHTRNRESSARERASSLASGLASFCQLARHAARTRAWTICASVGPASIVARVRLAVFSPSNRRGSVPIRRPVGESTLQPAGQLERPLPVSAWIEATGDVVAESSPIACCVTYSA